jgi:alkylation response protein AidB-like acyl-CoA dehydrogenase
MSNGAPGDVPTSLCDWLEEHADAIDCGSLDALHLLPRLADSGLYRWGVPGQFGGHANTDIGHAIEAIAAVGERSMAAAFVSWSQRVFIEFLLHTSNTALRDEYLTDLQVGRIAGASALSNAMKFLSGIESLQIEARRDGAGWKLNGIMPWVTNLRPQGYIVAAAVALPEGGAAVVALRENATGLERTPDLALLGLQSTNTAAIRLHDTPADTSILLHAQAHEFLPQLRPAFVGLQCAMSIGLARRALAETRRAGSGRAAVTSLAGPLDETATRVERLTRDLVQGVRDGSLVARPMDLFELRIGLAEAASAAVQLELQAAGGLAYLQGRQPGFPRRWREAAFVPIVTPSLVQLKTEIARRRQALAAGAAQ